jgi:K+-sensing histidine kinase KdpD
MRIKNADRWASTGSRTWAVSIGIFLMVFIFRLMLRPILGDLLAITGFVLAAFYIQYHYGFFKGALAAVAGYVLGEYAFVQPYASFEDLDADDFVAGIQLNVLIFACMLIIQRLRRSQYQAKLIAEVAESRYLMLLQAESDREAAERDFQESRLGKD